MTDAPKCARPDCPNPVTARDGAWQTYCSPRCGASKRRRESARLSDLRALVEAVAVGAAPVDLAVQQLHQQIQRADQRGYMRAMSGKRRAA